eukprot:4130222-Ditylum_brightwellii.AAC.1
MAPSLPHGDLKGGRQSHKNRMDAVLAETMCVQSCEGSNVLVSTYVQTFTFARSTLTGRLTYKR